MSQSRIAGAVRTRRAGLWALTAATCVAFSGALAGCGGSQTKTGEQVKADPVVEQQVNSMAEYYKTNPPGKTPKKK